MKNFLFYVFLLLFSLAANAQDRKPLKGKVIAETDGLEGIYVINKTAGLSAATTRGGYFTINAQPKDTLLFSAIQFEAKDVIISEKDFGETLLFVPLAIHTHNLDELVIVDYRHINAESLGLVPKGQKQYTPAEKKLATASKWRMNPLGLDPLINMFSGRTATLQKAAEAEKKELLMEKIGYIYSEEDIVRQFKIPEEYVRGFVFYCVENKYFAKAINAKDDNMAKFLLAGLAVKYLKLIDEK
ncbi:hypothetical protein HYN59_07015 [Flavobacterium album]|uniref:Carboxypeptidase-like regulatory domain-containing protein n=1 Tax=Flavobacterium album TaxID=2175091 RepID=A0A2S1QWV9_9FLAO|nr:hypothetical protein [Flavobacterium album]AWH84888.1 hypothetical protein HYN59_07015 [Flavobacterium album]